MINNQPSRVIVRTSYAEDATWREALPQSPLHVFVVLGESLDAPECMPAGSMRYSSLGGAFQSATFRE